MISTRRIVAAVGLVFALYKFSAKKPPPFQSIKITKLTNIGNATAAQISPNGEYVAHVVYEGGKNSVRVWDLATRRQIGTPLTGHSAPVNSVTFSPDGKTLASGCGHGVLKLWEVESGRCLWSRPAHQEVRALAFSPDGKLLASGTGTIGVYDGRTLRLWDAASGKLVRSF